MHGKIIELKATCSLEELIKFRNRLRKSNEILHVSLIILMQTHGISSFRASKMLRVNAEAARRWVLSFNREGLDGLLDKRRNNIRRDMFKNADFLKHLDETVNTTCIYGGLWSGKKLQQWVLEKYGRRVVVSTIYSWLYEIGYSWKSPRPTHIKGDKIEQEKFKKNHLPQ